MIDSFPVLLLKKLVLLPYQEVRLELYVELSKKIIDISENEYDKKLLVVCPNNPKEISPSIDELPLLGVIAKIKSKIELPNGNYRVVITGINRVIIKKYKNYVNDDNILEAKVKRIYINNGDEALEQATTRSLKNTLELYMDKNPEASNSIINSINTIEDLDMLTDVVTNYMPFDLTKKISYMNEFDYCIRANELIKDINMEIEILDLENKIDDEIREKFDQEQKEFIIKQKISKLNEELGLNADKQSEILLFNQQIEDLDIPDKTKKKLQTELRRYSYTNEANPDSSVIRNYLDTVINLPWNTSSKDEKDLIKIRKKLDKSHFGLEETKKRILEFIAIKNNNENISSPIICLVGPPGTGKTTLGISISQALNREFFKISMSGLNDPTELTGHKRTYLGSSPGKIIQGLKKCGTNNPVILIDEVDKVISDFKGDPSSVLLDILDKSQNNMFIDNYVEEPFDLSKVLFILTANDINAIPTVLKDRLEIIEISSYTEFEKVDIAKNYIIPNIIKNYNTKKVKISDEVILEIINYYTKESGVRELTRIFDKIYRSIILSEKSVKEITSSYLEKVLGNKKYEIIKRDLSYPGSVFTLGVTPFGGIVIPIETILTPGNGKIIITGNALESTKESIDIVFSYVLSIISTLKIKQDLFNKNNFHINMLNYNIKKEGGSGALAFTTSLISLLLNKPVSNDIAFTGEINLHGDILKVSGIKEKIIGAFNNSIKTIYIPSSNEIDLETIPLEIKEKINIICVSNYQSIYNDLFKKE